MSLIEFEALIDALKILNSDVMLIVKNGRVFAIGNSETANYINSLNMQLNFEELYHDRNEYRREIEKWMLAIDC